MPAMATQAGNRCMMHLLKIIRILSLLFQDMLAHGQAVPRQARRQDMLHTQFLIAGMTTIVTRLAFAHLIFLLKP